MMEFRCEKRNQALIKLTIGQFYFTSNQILVRNSKMEDIIISLPDYRLVSGIRKFVLNKLKSYRTIRLYRITKKGVNIGVRSKIIFENYPHFHVEYIDVIENKIKSYTQTKNDFSLVLN